MFKKSRYIKLLFTLFLCLFLAVSFPIAYAPEPAVAVEEAGINYVQTTDVEFPLKLQFKLSVSSDVDVADVRLHYTVERESFAQVTSEVIVDFAPGTAVDAQWDWDMRKTGGLPPGTWLDYWWTVKDANGGEIETALERFRFDDNRYVWKSLTEGKVTVYWYEGDNAFGNEIMLAAQQALTRLENSTGAFLKDPVRLFVYASAQDLQGAMVFPQEWTGGVTFSRYSVIAIGIAPSALSWGREAIAHELTHMVVHQMTSNPYGALPTWLEEGLAMNSESLFSPAFTTSLENAIATDSLISVRSLSSPFSAYAEQSYLSYAESYTLVKFLIEGYGQSKMFELLNTFSHGSSYDGALEKVYGFDTEGLDDLWRGYVIDRFK